MRRSKLFLSALTFIITSATPSPGSINVPTTTTPTITFSEALDANSLDHHLELRHYADNASAASATPATLTLSPDQTTVTFQLATPLEHDSRYYFYVEAGVKNLAGETLAEADRWLHGTRDQHSFTTVAATVPPIVPPTESGQTTSSYDQKIIHLVKTGGYHPKRAARSIKKPRVSPLWASLDYKLDKILKRLKQLGG